MFYDRKAMSLKVYLGLIINQIKKVINYYNCQIIRFNNKIKISLQKPIEFLHNNILH